MTTGNNNWNSGGGGGFWDNPATWQAIGAIINRYTDKDDDDEWKWSPEERQLWNWQMQNLQNSPWRNYMSSYADQMLRGMNGAAGVAPKSVSGRFNDLGMGFSIPKIDFSRMPNFAAGGGRPTNQGPNGAPIRNPDGTTPNPLGAGPIGQGIGSHGRNVRNDDMPTSDMLPFPRMPETRGTGYNTNVGTPGWATGQGGADWAGNPNAPNINGVDPDQWNTMFNPNSTPVQNALLEMEWARENPSLLNQFLNWASQNRNVLGPAASAFGALASGNPTMAALNAIRGVYEWWKNTHGSNNQPRP
jgi:hypothetical protein